MAVAKSEILDAALEVLRHGGPLTLDSVARAAGLTKPGVVHHFATKEVLTLSVLDHLLDRWEVQLRERAGPRASPTARLGAYVEHTLLGEMDSADLALLADPRLRDKLVDRWTERMDSWFGDATAPGCVAARLLADGAWINRCMGMLDLRESERRAILALATSLLDDGIN